MRNIYLGTERAGVHRVSLYVPPVAFVKLPTKTCPVQTVHLLKEETRPEMGNKLLKVTQPLWDQCGPRAQAVHKVPCPAALLAHSAPQRVGAEWAQLPSCRPARRLPRWQPPEAFSPLLLLPLLLMRHWRPRPTSREFAQSSQGCLSLSWGRAD